MKKNIKFSTLNILIVLMTSFFSFGQKLPSTGKNIIDNSRLKYIRTSPQYGEISLLEHPAVKGVSLKIKTTKRPQFIYKANARLPLKTEALEKGQIVLLSFLGKTIKSGLETGEARFLCILNQTGNYKGNIESTISLSTEFKNYFIPYEITQNVKADDLKVVLQFGYQPQEAIIGNIKVTVFKKGTDISTLPKTKIKYYGMEDSAEWRKQANKRIEEIRKGNFEIQFLKNGKPVTDKSVYLKQIKHEFGWGATLNAADVVADPNQVKYAVKGFNKIVFANDLKIKSWSREKNRPRTLKALKLIKDAGLQIKGHVLIWPGFQYQTKQIRLLENKPNELIETISRHVLDITNKTKGFISHWDVVNEAYTNKDFQRITGSEEILYGGFRALKKAQPNVGRFTNEYGIISKGGIDTQKQDWYYNYIKRLDINTNGAVDGIGIQCHIGSDLTSPKRVIDILDYYGTLNKSISISEFTMEIKDEEVKQKYTSDFITAAFSHPNVSEFLFWGFHESGNPKAVIYNNDWSLATMGKAYYNLVHKKWNTYLNTKTNTDGLVKGRGFYGTYEFGFWDGDYLKRGSFKIKKGYNNKITIEIK